jgi:hypothetical protein
MAVYSLGDSPDEDPPLFRGDIFVVLDEYFLSNCEDGKKLRIAVIASRVGVSDLRFTDVMEYSQPI